MTKFVTGIAILGVVLALVLALGNVVKAQTGYSGRSGSYSDTINKFGSDKAINSSRGVDMPLENGRFDVAEPYDFPQDIGR